MMRGFWRPSGRFSNGRSTPWIAVGVALTVAGACATFEGLQLAASPVKKADGSVPTCTLAKPAKLGPTVPVEVNTPPDFVVAMKWIDLGDRRPDGGVPNFEKVGFDLDNTCTGEGAGPSCVRPKWAGLNPDGPGGRDNAFQNFFVTGDAGPQSPNTSHLADSGQITAVLRVKGYGGSPDDGVVTVESFAATGCKRAATATGYACPGLDGGPATFHWRGNDSWTPLIDWVTPKTRTDGGAVGGPWLPKFTSDRAYVSNHILVAHFPAARFAMAIDFSDLWVQGRLEPVAAADGGGWALRDGMMAGRAKIDDVLADIEFFIDPATGFPICTNSPAYAAFKRNACGHADISFAGNDAKAPCDAASWAFKFEAFPAKLVEDDVIGVTDMDFRTCGASSPKNDHCNTLDGGPP